MVVVKAKKTEDLEALKSDVASFASSLGLSSAVSAHSGFNDVDFRKSGPLKAPKASKPRGDHSSAPPDGKKQNQKVHGRKPEKRRGKGLNGISEFVDGGKRSEQSKSNNKNNLPKLPLMRAKDLSGQWFTDSSELEVKIFGTEGKSIEAKELEKVKRLASQKTVIAQRLIDQYSRDYEASRGKSGDMKMLEKAQRAGTAADKVAAFTCKVEDNPIANIRSLDALLAMVMSKVGKRHAVTGFDVLRDLFLLRLLPDRKLKCLLQRPLNHLPESKDGNSLLLFWYWEECLKLRYERFIVALEEASRDMLPILKDKSLKTISTLLKNKSEQERRLLSALVNKLGDPERKTASGACYHLTCLLSAHPNMKAVVIEEVDTFIFRPQLGMRAKYHAVNFLSQILLCNKGEGPKVAKRLVDVYFAVFKVLMTNSGTKQTVETKGRKESQKVVSKSKEENDVQVDVEMDSRLLSALLTGVNRAFPYVATADADDIIEVQTPLLFKLVHSKNFNVGVQALMLLFQISSKNQIASDRFYRALYAKLLIPAVMNSSKPEMFLGLLFKSMKNDVNMKRVSAFSKRLLQVALQQPPHYTCACLFILSEVLKAKPPLWTVMLQNESADDELEHFEDIIEDLSIAPDAVPSSKLESSLNGRSNSEGVKTENDEDNSDSEDGEDLPGSDSEEDNSSEGEDNLIVRHATLTTGKFQNISDQNREQPQVSNVRSSLPGGYDARHREPCYCNADRTSWWELTILASHVHPSVSTMARTLLSGANIVYNGDPIKDLSLGAFLDKFIEKKPKLNRRAEGTWHGGSQIAPARKLDMKNHLIGAEILSLAEDEVPPEDLVFHKFYTRMISSSSKPKKKKKRTAGDEADALFDVAESDPSDDEVDKLGSSGNLPLDSSGDYDYDDLDEVDMEADEDLLGNDSDADLDDHPNEDSAISDDDGIQTNDSDKGDINSGNDSSDNNEDSGGVAKPSPKKNKKRKLQGRAGASPFASLEDYDHLLNGEEDSSKTYDKIKPQKKLRSRQKKRPKRG